MSTMFHIYGDESIVGDNVVYALVIVPVEKIEFAETTLGNIKEKFGAPRSARFHCREVFQKDARRKTDWAHLTDKEAFDLAIAITDSLAGKGLETRIGHVDANAVVREFPGVGGLPPMTIQQAKQLIPLAYQAALAPFAFDGKYANHCKIWIDPNDDVIGWHGVGRQIERLLKINRVNLDARLIEPIMIPENLGSKEKPMLLELADMLAYCSCRVLANSKQKSRYSDRVTRAIYESMNPAVGRMNLIPPEQTKESLFVNFAFTGRR